MLRILQLNKKYFILLLILIISITGCTQDKDELEYKTLIKNFYNIYFDTVQCIDLKDTISSLKNLQSDKHEENIKELGNLLNSIKEKVPQEQNLSYVKLTEWYEELIFLKDAYARIDKLDDEDKGRIDKIFILIGVRRENWKDKDKRGRSNFDTLLK